MMETLWIWDMVEMRQAALIQQTRPIKFVKWNPTDPKRFAFNCSTGFIYIWHQDRGCESIEIPACNNSIFFDL